MEVAGVAPLQNRQVSPVRQNRIYWPHGGSSRISFWPSTVHPSIQFAKESGSSGALVQNLNILLFFLSLTIRPHSRSMISCQLFQWLGSEKKHRTCAISKFNKKHLLFLPGNKPSLYCLSSPVSITFNKGIVCFKIVAFYFNLSSCIGLESWRIEEYRVSQKAK